MKYIQLLLLLFLSCDNNEENKEDETFPLSYTFYNSTNDQSINAVELDTYTYFPKDDITNYRSHNFQRKDLEENNGHVRTTLRDRVYKDCTRIYLISISKAWVDTIVGRPRQWREFVMPKDTIDCAKDSIYQFSWPEDTLKAIQINNLGF